MNHDAGLKVFTVHVGGKEGNGKETGRGDIDREKMIKIHSLYDNTKLDQVIPLVSCRPFFNLK